jgi:ubiquitin-activating enzyme E1
LPPAAKNVILASVRAITVHDKKAVEVVDLGAQFYLNDTDVGKNRASACCEKLQELNGAVAVTASEADLEEDFLKKFQVGQYHLLFFELECLASCLFLQVVVCTCASQADALRIDQICHANGVRFIWAQTYGVFARVFTDFGVNFQVIDVNGEEKCYSATCPLLPFAIDHRRRGAAPGYCCISHRVHFPAGDLR